MDASQFYNVGYMTNRALLRDCVYSQGDAEFAPPLPITQRKYLVSFVGMTHPIPRFYYRTLLYNYIKDKKNTIPEDMLIHFDEWSPKQKHWNDTWLDGSSVSHTSVMYLSLPGDSPTTDRIFGAFEHLTLIGSLSHEKEDLLVLLPFRPRVPWEDIIIWIDTDAYVKDPLAACRAAIEALDVKERERRVDLLRKYKREVIWNYNESVMLFNTLEDARDRVKSLHKGGGKDA